MKTSRKKSLLMGALLMGAIAFTGGCQSSDESASKSSGTPIETPTPEAAKSTLSFGFDLTALKQQTLEKRNSYAIENFRGTLTAKDVSTDVTKTFDTVLSVDDKSWNIASETTVVLAPGIYDFTMVFSNNKQQYAGSKNQTTILDGTNDVKMTIRPIIGDTTTEVSIVDRLPYLRFKYDQINLTQFTNPRLGVLVDELGEEVFELDPQNGLADQYLNVIPGKHSIRLKLYDGDIVKGKSVLSQQDRTIAADNQEILMDLQPVHGETTFTFDEEGGDADFTFQIPAEVIDEADGKENLRVDFSMVGPKNSQQDRQVTIGDQSGDFYKGTVTTLTGVQYDTITLSLNFFDTREAGDNAILGSCNTSLTLEKNEGNVICDLKLRKRAIAGGKLMSVVGINVYDESNKMVQGATLKDQNNTILGITGSGEAFGTEGYLKFLLPTGQHTIYAMKGDFSGSVDVSADLFDINNHVIFLKRNSFKSCNAIKKYNPASTSGTYTIDPDGPTGANAPYEVYCDMTTEGGGWTLTATFANDQNDYWTWNNRANLWNGNEEGELANALTNDFQSKAWKEVTGDDILFKATDSKYLIYDTMIENNTVASTQFEELKNSTEFAPSIIIGDWWHQCPDSSSDIKDIENPEDILKMSTSHEDIDGHAWKEGSKGFVWRSKNNYICDYDDSVGGLMTSNASASGVYLSKEIGWDYDFFYTKNFTNSPLKVFVR